MRRLQQMREERGLNQKKVAEDLNISRSAYSSYETGAREPSLDMLIKMADYFGLSVDELLSHCASHPTRDSLLSSRERKLIYGFRLLKEPGKMRVENVVDFENDMQQQEQAAQD